MANAPSLDVLIPALERGVHDERPYSELLDPRGSWNLSEVLQHCAQSIRYSVTGYPRLGSAAFRATIGPIVKHLFLWRGSVKHDRQAPLAGAPTLDPQRSVQDSFAELETSIALFRAHRGPMRPHPAYGRCSSRQYAALHAMHIVDHLPGLVTPESS